MNNELNIIVQIVVSLNMNTKLMTYKNIQDYVGVSRKLVFTRK